MDGYQSYSDWRTHLDVLWIFKRKARYRWTKWDDYVLAEMPEKAYEVDHAYSKWKYEPAAVFCDGKKYFQRKGIEDIGKCLHAGMSVRQTSIKLGLCIKRCLKVRNALDKFIGHTNWRVIYKQGGK